jgi:hypothetical protein
LVYFVRYFWLISFAGVAHFIRWGCSFHSLFAESANDLRRDLDFDDEIFGGLVLGMGLRKYERYGG